MKAEILVLGVLHRGDLHPYEIKRRLEAAQVSSYIDVDVGTLYYAVRQLAKDGMIEVRGQQSVARGGERTIYGLTDAGRTRFQALMLERFADRSPSHHPLYPALLFLHLADQGQVASLLRTRLDELARHLVEIERMQTLLAPVVATGTRYLIERGLAVLRVEQDWLARLLADVEAGRVQGPNLAAAKAAGLLSPADLGETS